MRFTPDSISNRLPLDAALARLAANAQVDGLALFGSRAGGAASDYDLLIMVDHLPVDIFQMLTHIGGVLTDVVFVTTTMADRLLAETPAVSDRTDEGRFLLKLVTAEIVYDASGRLGRAQAQARQHPPAASPAYAATYAAWFWPNHTLVHVRWMARSSDPVRLTAVDLMLAAGISNACRAYCQVRGLAWQGEKAALRYLDAHDLAYLTLLRACLAEADRPRRVELFGQLVAATLHPAGEMWQPGLTAVVLGGADSGPADLDAALGYWEAFFTGASGSAQ